MKIYITVIFFIILMFTLLGETSHASQEIGKILYTKNKALYIASLTSDGLGESKKICNLKYSEQFPDDCLWSKLSLSPDGKKITFIEDEDIMDANHWGYLCIMNTDGSGFQKLTSESANNINFRWFSDNKRILYSEEVIDARGNYHSGIIYVMNVETGERKTLIQKGTYPSLSSDEKKVLYIFERTDYTDKKGITTKLYSVDIDGKNNRFIAEVPGWPLFSCGRYFTEGWSKDGAMALLREFVVNVKTGKYFRYAEEYTVRGAKWFLDNQHFCYISDPFKYPHESEYNIVVTDINGSYEKQLTKSGDVSEILTITEKKIYYTRKISDNKSLALWSIDLDGSNPVKILDNIDYSYDYDERTFIWFPGK